VNLFIYFTRVVGEAASRQKLSHAELAALNCNYDGIEALARAAG
jgi:hypothetical protein